MKKLLVVMMALTLGGVAYGSTLGVPWFVDTGIPANKLPPNSNGVVGIVYLHNNLQTTINCSIEYFTAGGTSVGPLAPDNTFSIAANASLGFRPVASDPSTVAGGQEATDSGWLVPDRPTTTDVHPDTDGKKNGSCVITWMGGPSDVQGVYLQEQLTTRDGEGKIVAFAHLLPPGA